MICNECNITSWDDKGWILTKELNLCMKCKHELSTEKRTMLHKEMYGDSSCHRIISWAAVDYLNDEYNNSLNV